MGNIATNDRHNMRQEDAHMLKAVGNSYTQTKLRKIQQEKDGEMAKL